MGTFHVFANCKPRLSESPIHSEKDQRLYWRGLDGEIFSKSYDTHIDDFEVFHLGVGSIGSIVQQDDYFLLFGDNGCVWRWSAGNQPVLLRQYPIAHFNDCLADCKGRIYCGILAENYFDVANRGKQSYLACIDVDGQLRIMDTFDATTPNGIRFSLDNNLMYFAVTDLNCVFVYDYDAESGELSNKRIFAEDCFPDGIAMDGKGNLWVTDCRLGGPLICYNPLGDIIRREYFPVRRVISVGFGGEKRNQLFVTTAHEGEPVGEYDGGVFVLDGEIDASVEYKGKVKW